MHPTSQRTAVVAFWHTAAKLCSDAAVSGSAQRHSDGAGAAEEALPSLMLLILKSERELASEAIRQDRLTNVLPLFHPYLAGVPL